MNNIYVSTLYNDWQPYMALKTALLNSVAIITVLNQNDLRVGNKSQSIIHTHQSYGS